MSSTAASVSSPLLPISCLSTSSTQSSSSSSLSSPLLGQRSRTVLNKDNQLKLSCLPGPSESPSLSMNSVRSLLSVPIFLWHDYKYQVTCNFIFDITQGHVFVTVDDTQNFLWLSSECRNINKLKIWSEPTTMSSGVGGGRLPMPRAPFLTLFYWLVLNLLENACFWVEKLPLHSSNCPCP